MFDEILDLIIGMFPSKSEPWKEQTKQHSRKRGVGTTRKSNNKRKGR